MYGLSGTPERFGLRCLTPQTPIRGLYLTGQDVASPGVTGALFGGVLTVSAILKRNLMGAIAKEGNGRKRKREHGLRNTGRRSQELVEQTPIGKDSTAEQVAPSAFGESSDGSAVGADHRDRHLSLTRRTANGQ